MTPTPAHPSDPALPLLTSLPRAELAAALTTHADALDQRSHNLSPNTPNPAAVRHDLRQRADTLRVTATALTALPERDLTTLDTADLVSDIHARVAAVNSGWINDGQWAASSLRLAAVATEAADRLAARTDTLDFHDAVALAEIIRAAQGRNRVARQLADGTAVVRHVEGIVTDREVRDGTLRVSGPGGDDVEHWPIRDLIREYNSGAFLPAYEQYDPPATTPTTPAAGTAGEDHELRVYEPALGSDDASRTYVLDALGGSIMLRRRLAPAEDTDPDAPGDGTEPEDTIDTVVELTDFAGTVTVKIRGDEHTFQ